jgi:hypothetical protein
MFGKAGHDHSQTWDTMMPKDSSGTLPQNPFLHAVVALPEMTSSQKLVS